MDVVAGLLIDGVEPSDDCRKNVHKLGKNNDYVSSRRSGELAQ
jgi:hypothetical protein